MKRLLLTFVLIFLLIPYLSHAKDLYEEQLDRGIRNSEIYSYLLIQESKIHNSEAKAILIDALRYSPDLPANYFELSKTSFAFSPEGIFEAFDYMLKGIGAYKRNFWWLFTFTGSLFMSLVVSFIISVVIIILIRLPFDIPLLNHDLKEDSNKIILLLALVASIVNPLFLLGGIFVIIGMYMTKWDRVFVYFYLSFLLISPWIFNTSLIFFSAMSSGKLKAIVEVNESKGNKYALSILRKGSDYDEQFSYALALKREGGYLDAMNIYSRLISESPTPEGYNNLANCYVAISDFKRAKELYLKSTAIKQLPTNLYNLSVISREMLDYEKGDEYFLSAQKLDREAVLRFRRIFNRNPNRFVIDESLPNKTFWRYAMEKTSSIYPFNLSIMPQFLIYLNALFLMAFFYVMNRRFRHMAYRCKRCGTILCNKCEKRILWGRMCLNCYRSLIKLDELDAKERITRLLLVYKYRKTKRDIIKIISLLLPGTGQIYAGDILYGLFFLWPFLFFMFIPIINSIFVPGTSFFNHKWFSYVSLILMAVVYVISNILTRRRLAKGWL